MSRFGLRRDDRRHSRLNFSRVRSEFAAKPRGYADLSGFNPPHMNQDLAGACVGHGLAGASYTTLAARGMRLEFVPSPLGIYNAALCIDRAADNPHLSVFQLPALKDDGTFVLSGVKAMSEWGVRPLVPNPLTGSDCTPQSVTAEPDQIALGRSSQHLIVGAVELNVWDMDAIETEVQLALDAGYTVVSGAFVGTPWLNYRANSAPLGAQDASDPKGGGHCTYVDSYRTDPGTGETIYGGRNSWEPTWGKSGRFECTGAAVRQWWEAYILKVKVA